MRSWPLQIVAAVLAIFSVPPLRGALKQWGQNQAMRGRQRSHAQRPPKFFRIADDGDRARATTGKVTARTTPR